MSRLLLITTLFLSSCGKIDIGPTRSAARDVSLDPIAAATPAVRDSDGCIVTTRQVRIGLQFRRAGQPLVTQKQIDDCLGPGYALVIDRVATARGQHPETHILYLIVPKTVAAADVATKLATLADVEQVRIR